MNSFVSLHPITAALYFLSVLSFAMFSSNPFLILSAFFGGLALYIKLSGRINLKESGLSVVLFALIALTNPLFSHKGVTVLFFLSGNPITLESILYGINNAFMILAVVYWFKCINIVITSDKLLYLFAGFSPKTALLISSALGFVPRLKAQSERIRASQKTLGLYASDTWTDRLKGTLRVYSALITWGLENAIDSGNSMKARGYGLPHRTHYSLYTFRKCDAFLITLIVFADISFIFALSSNWFDFEFYPQICYSQFEMKNASVMSVFVAFCLLPLIIEIKEGLKWKYYVSKI